MQVDRREQQTLFYRKPPFAIKCPLCNSPDLVAVSNEGLWEAIKVKLLKMRPYRCLDCDFRFVL